MAIKIEIVPYNPAWAEAFEQERRQLEAQLGMLQARIEHIGSTAVAGLGAKPVIDIMVGLESREAINEVVAPLLDLGYCYYSCFEAEIPERRFFARLCNLQRQVYHDRRQLPPRDQFQPTHHLQVVPYDSLWWKRHLAFRDYLRTHSMARDAYHRMKVKLAKGTWEGANDYAEAKTGFIRRIEWLIGLNGLNG